MAIDPAIRQIDTSAVPPATRPSPAAANRHSRFEEALALHQQGGCDAEQSLSPAAAAEVLRLEMLRTAMIQGLPPQETSSLPAGAAASSLFTLPSGHPVSDSSPVPPSSAIPASPPGLSADIAPGTTGRQAVSPVDIDGLIHRAARHYGIDAALIKAVIRAESDFNPRAVSRAGAQGLMQLMPATARGLGVTNSFDPEQNIMAGSRFLKDLLIRYGGDIDVALAAYNWGPGNVDRHGLAVPKETRDYLARVKNYYLQYAG